MGGVVPWTAYDSQNNVVRLNLDKTTFDIVYIARLKHIQDNISKFRDTLQPKVENASTNEEIDAIQW
jgi:hypothetical protein